MNSNLEERERDEVERNNDVFLYSTEHNSGGESCNLICLFLLFISFFFIMLITADNTTANTDYENNKETEMVNDTRVAQGNAMNDWLDNMLIQSLNFKGHYMIHDKMKELHVNRKINDTQNDNEKKNKETKSMHEHKNVKKGSFEAKLIILRLAMNNANKAYIFFHFDPPKGYKKAKKKNKKYEFVGISGINVNKNDRYIFSGLGYNISNFCQNFDENCICNYNINIKQNISNYESISLRELDESHLYSLKNYLLDETEYYKSYIFHKYYEYYKKRLFTMSQQFRENVTDINVYDDTVFITVGQIEKGPEFVKTYGNKGITNDGYIYDLHKTEKLNSSFNSKEAQENTTENIANVEKEMGEIKNTEHITNKINEKEEKDREQYEKEKKTSIENNESHSVNESLNVDTNEINNGKEKTEDTTKNYESANKNENENNESINSIKENNTEIELGEDNEETEKKDYEGHMLSNNCNFYVSLKGNDVDRNYIWNRVTNFSILYNIKSIIELSLFGKQIGNSENVHNAAKVSLISICLNSFIEVFESLLLLYEILLSRSLLMHFIIMVLLKFLLFTLMEVRYVLIIWKATHQREMNGGWETMQRKLSKLYKYYYGSILLVIVLFYYVFPLYPYILLVLYLCWIPQICLDIWKGQRKSVNLKFVFFLSLCRMCLPIYIFLYPDNIFQLDAFIQIIDTSNSTFTILLIIIMVAQYICMLVQRICGPRCFFNIELLPHVHNYYKAIDINFEAGVPECVICMYDISIKDKKYCVTPCYHIFHEKCLQQWMNVKLECPTCRGALPNFP